VTLIVSFRAVLIVRSKVTTLQATINTETARDRIDRRSGYDSRGCFANCRRTSARRVTNRLVLAAVLPATQARWWIGAVMHLRSRHGWIRIRPESGFAW